MFVLHFVFGCGVVYATSCSQEGGQCARFTGSTVEVDDKSVNAGTRQLEDKISVLVKELRKLHVHTKQSWTMSKSPGPDIWPHIQGMIRQGI